MVESVRQERRAAPRVAFKSPVLYAVGPSTHLDYALDLSENGLAVETTWPAVLRQRLTVRFVHPVLRRDLRAEAEFVWLADHGPDPLRPRRAGLRFVEVDPTVRTLLADLVHSGTTAAAP